VQEFPPEPGIAAQMIPALMLDILFLEFIEKIIEFFDLHAIDVIGEVASRIDLHNHNHGDHCQHAGAKKSSEQFVGKLHLHGLSFTVRNAHEALGPSLALQSSRFDFPPAFYPYALKNSSFFKSITSALHIFSTLAC
jgi:hypothetical protein